MPIDPKALETAILQSIPQAAVRVENLRNDGESYWFAHIASPVFKTLPLLDQHRMIYAAIKGLWDPDADALTLKTTGAR